VGLPVREYPLVEAKTTKRNEKVKKTKTMWIELSQISRKSPASLEDCIKGVMYHPGGETITDEQYPVFDLYFKNETRENGTDVRISVTGLQVSVEQGTRVITLTSVKKLYERLKIGVHDKVKVDYIYCGHPRRIQEAQIKLPSKDSIQDSPRYMKETDAAYNSRINELLLLRDVVVRDWTIWVAEMPDNYKLESKAK
jgi:hypothetical protein